MTNSNERLKNRLRTHSSMILDAFVLALWVTALIMFAIMVLGIYRIGEGIITEFKHSHDKPDGLINILKGLELIFISPLFYLLVLSLTKYISATRPEMDLPSLDTKKLYMNHAIMEIMNVKILSVSLFISVLVLHSIGLILVNEMAAQVLTYIISILVVLIIYYFVLDWMVEKLRKHP